MTDHWSASGKNKLTKGVTRWSRDHYSGEGAEKIEAGDSLRETIKETHLRVQIMDKFAHEAVEEGGLNESKISLLVCDEVDLVERALHAF